MFNFLSNITPNHLAILSITVSVVGITFSLINSYYAINNVVMERQVDNTRVQEGLPTDVTLTPEDFRDNPELAEIFGVTDTDNDLDIILESDEHFEQVQNQLAAINIDNFMTLYDIIEAFISTFI